MGFFGSISDFFKDDVAGVFKGAYEDVIKPIAGDLYSDVAKPLVKTGVNVVSQTAQNATDFSKNLGNLVTNPVIWIGGLVVAVIVLPRILER